MPSGHGGEQGGPFHRQRQRVAPVGLYVEIGLGPAGLGFDDDRYGPRPSEVCAGVAVPGQSHGFGYQVHFMGYIGHMSPAAGHRELERYPLGGSFSDGIATFAQPSEVGVHGRGPDYVPQSSIGVCGHIGDGEIHRVDVQDHAVGRVGALLVCCDHSRRHACQQQYGHGDDREGHAPARIVRFHERSFDATGDKGRSLHAV